MSWVYTDMFGMKWTAEELEAMQGLRCEKHDRAHPCRPCLWEEGFYCECGGVKSVEHDCSSG